MAKLVSQVYAEALFGLGVENGLLDTLLEELNGMCEILGKNPQFVTLLGHPELDQKEKTAVFDRVFDGKISKELNGFCHLPVSYTHLDVYKRQVLYCIRVFTRKRGN